MAGMFYSLQEAAEKLNKTEDEIKQLVKDGQLREFRDGTNLLFKVEEVDGLVTDAGQEQLEEILTTEEEPELSESQEPTEEMKESEAELEEKLEEEAEPEPEPETELEAEPEPEPEPELEPILEESSEPEPEEEPEPEFELAQEELQEIEESQVGAPEEEKMEESDLGLEEPVPSGELSDSSEILLAAESGELPSDLTDADTALTGQGTSVLGETDQGYDITDDSLAETAFAAGPTGSSPEVPLEEVEEDVNLDSFGSGSGLLDLSLQADDTSLGGILDEIYTAEGEGQEPVTAGPGAEPESDVAAAPDDTEPISEEGAIAAQPAAEMAAIAQPIIEVAPDSQSKILGMMLILPLIIVIYTIVVVIAGMKDIMPSILQSIQGFVWYIMGGAIVVSALVAGGAFVLTGERAARPKKEKKPRKEKVKKEKPKKEKKKKEKKPKKSK